MDPMMGIVGGLVIARWSWGLIRDSGRVLLDYVDADEDLPDEIRKALEVDDDRITDLHIWQLGPGPITVLHILSGAMDVRSILFPDG